MRLKMRKVGACGSWKTKNKPSLVVPSSLSWQCQHQCKNILFSESYHQYFPWFCLFVDFLCRVVKINFDHYKFFYMRSILDEIVDNDVGSPKVIYHVWPHLRRIHGPIQFD